MLLELLVKNETFVDREDNKPACIRDRLDYVFRGRMHYIARMNSEPCLSVVMASSHRLHRQDKTVSSRRRRRCELSWRQSQTVFSSRQYIGDNSFVQSRLRCECICELVLTQFPNMMSQ